MSAMRFSPSCENNRIPILKQLKRLLPGKKVLLEIGSGTGQHAAYFAPEFIDLQWQTSDVIENHDSIKAWAREANVSNLLAPCRFRVGEDPWPTGEFDVAYTANTAHIMQRQEVELLMQLVAENLVSGSIFLQYGPFRIDGEFNGESNRAFHHRLLAEGLGGYRDINELVDWAKALSLVEQITMPANNMLLVWKKH